MKSVPFLLSALLGSTVGFAPVQTTTRPSTSLAFFGGGAKKAAATKKYPQAAEAVELYTDKFMSGGKRRQKFFFESWGMPGTYSAPVDDTANIFERQVADLTAAFDVIAGLYGPEEALAMVRIQPGVLAFKKENFGPSLEFFGEKFGLEESKAMVLRNPGLLSVQPSSAETADDLTMQLSYVVSVTRPIGNFGPAFIAALLSVPALENALGVGRGELFSSLLNQ